MLDTAGTDDAGGTVVVADSSAVADSRAVVADPSAAIADSSAVVADSSAVVAVMTGAALEDIAWLGCTDVLSGMATGEDDGRATAAITYNELFSKFKIGCPATRSGKF